MFYQLVVVLCLCVLWKLWNRKQSALEPPELSGKLPILGHSYMIIGDGKKLLKSIVKISKECLEKGGIVTVNFGFRKVYGIADPEDSMTVVNSSIEKHYFYNFGKPFLGNGLITADGATWKKHRKLLNPTLNQQIINSYIEIFNVQARSLVKSFATELEKPFDHENHVRITNLKTVIITTFGVSVQDYGDLINQYIPRFQSVVQSINERMQNFWLHSDFIYNMTQKKKMLDIDLKYLLAMTKSIIQKKKSDKRNAIHNEAKTDKNTFTSLILDLADETGCFTDDQIREQVDTIIVGGYDTSATIISLTLTLLGSYLDVQEKAFNEIFLVLGNSDRDIEKDDLSKLVYIEAVLKEVLRLYPILPLIPRSLEKDIKLKNYTIKANSECFIINYGLLRHDIWGPDADQFRPERWLEKETLPDPKYFGGFGLGRRSCIGRVYAMTLMKITLAHVLRKYSISSDISKMVLKMHISIRSELGHFITIKERMPKG